MSNVLFEYDGIPVKYEKIDSTTISFIVVYTTGNNDYIKRRFVEFENAMDFEEPNARFILKFISEDLPDGRNFNLKHIKYNKGKELSFSYNIVDRDIKDCFTYILVFNSGSLDIQINDYRVGQQREWFISFQRTIMSTSKGKPRHFHPKFLTYFPKFEDDSKYEGENFFGDCSLEVLFLFYNSLKNFTNLRWNFGKEILETYLMQTKKRYEELEIVNEENDEEEIDFDTAEEISPEDSIIPPISNEIPIVNDYINKDEVLYEIDQKINILNEKNNTKINALEIKLNNLKELIEIGLLKNNNKINIIVFLFIVVIIILFFLLKQLD